MTRGFWHINAVVINSSLPDGPTSLDELFDWPWRYAQQLLVHHEKKNTFRATFAENSKYNINVTESYAGMGTGSYTLHHQFNALKGVLRESDRGDGTTPGCGSVRSISAYDVDAHCQKVLASLSEEVRPLHVGGALEDRLAPGVHMQLEIIKNKVQSDLSKQLSQLHQKKQDYTAKGLAEQEQKIKEDSGNLLMNKYMAFLLSTKDNFMQTATCYSCGRRTDATSPPKKRAKKVVGEEDCSRCPTPVGMASGQVGATRSTLNVAVAGTTCVDVSPIGKGQKLLGDSSMSLAVWLAERVFAGEDVIVHECSTRFDLRVFQQFLPNYTIHRLYQKDKPLSACFLSPHHFGWPCHRPRAFSVLTRNDTVFLSEEGLQVIESLFVKPVLPASSLYCAPQDEVEKERIACAHRLCRPLASPFLNLLAGEKPLWVDHYRRLDKVRRFFDGGPSRSMICNLLQNPATRPIISGWQPALLRQGVMWLLLHSDKSKGTDDINAPASSVAPPSLEERWMLDKEHLNSMGVPQREKYAARQAWPLFRHQPPPTVVKRLAGNAMHPACVGSLYAALLVTMKLRDPRAVTSVPSQV